MEAVCLSAFACRYFSYASVVGYMQVTISTIWYLMSDLSVKKPGTGMGLHTCNESIRNSISFFTFPNDIEKGSS